MALPGIITCEDVEVTVTPGEFIWERGEVEGTPPYDGDPALTEAEYPWGNDRLA